MVECHLAKVKVAGPNPVSRSKKERKTHSPLRIPRIADCDGMRTRGPAGFLPPQTSSRIKRSVRKRRTENCLCGYPVSRSKKHGTIAKR